MSDFNRDEIQELKNLRAELLSEYDEGLNEVSNAEEALLLRQNILEEYNYAKESSPELSNSYNYEDDDSESSSAPVKTLTDERSL